MFNKDFVWNCQVCGNINTYDPVVIKENITNQPAGFTDTEETSLLCHHCLRRFAVRLRGNIIILEKLSNPNGRDINNIIRSFMSTPLSTKVRTSMKNILVQQEKRSLVSSKGNYWIARLQLEGNALMAIMSTRTDGELCRRTFQEFDTIHVRNIFEYYSTLEYITDICKQLRIPYTMEALTDPLPASFHKNDYLLVLNLANNKMDITSIEYDVETVGLVYCVSYAHFAIHIEDYITMLSKP